MDLLDVFVIPLEPLRHHRHDPLEPLLVDPSHVPGVDPVVDVVVISVR